MFLLKPFLIFLLIFGFASCSIIKPYHYYFFIQDNVTESSIIQKNTIETKDSLITISGFAYDCNGEPAVNSTVYLANANNRKHTLVTLDGSFEITSDKLGMHYFEINAVCENIQDTLDLALNHHYQYEINLGRTGCHTHIRYKSPKKLSETEREKIYYQLSKQNACPND